MSKKEQDDLNNKLMLHMILNDNKETEKSIENANLNVKQ